MLFGGYNPLSDNGPLGGHCLVRIRCSSTNEAPNAKYALGGCGDVGLSRCPEHGHLHVSTTATAIWWDNMVNHKNFLGAPFAQFWGEIVRLFSLDRHSKKVLGICRYVSQQFDWFRLWLVAATFHHVHVVPKTAEKYHWYPSKQHIPNIHPTKRDLKPSHPIKLVPPARTISLQSVLGDWPIEFQNNVGAAMGISGQRLNFQFSNIYLPTFYSVNIRLWTVYLILLTKWMPTTLNTGFYGLSGCMPNLTRSSNLGTSRVRCLAPGTKVQFLQFGGLRPRSHSLQSIRAESRFPLDPVSSRATAQI